jgi:hypothetical protein
VKPHVDRYREDHKDSTKSHPKRTAMTGAAVEIVFELFRRRFPVPALAPSERPLSKEERRAYGVWELMSLFPLFLFAGILTYLWYLALGFAVDFSLRMPADTEYLIQPHSLVWLVPAMMLGLLTAVFPLNVLLFVLLRDRYRRFSRFCDERVGFDGYRAFRAMAIVFIILCLGYSWIAASFFARFTRQGVEIGRPLWFGNFYNYKQIQRIEHRATLQAPNGNIVHRPHYVILFDDGASWSTDEFSDLVPDEAARIVQLVSRRSGRAIDERP